MKSTDIRTFPSAAEVVQSFHRRGEPAQRSIQRIAESGFYAGICLPLTFANRSFGFLFLNSRKAEFSELRPLDYSLLAFLQSIVVLALSHEMVSSVYFDLAERHEADYLADFFDPLRFEQSVQNHLQSLSHSCHIELNQNILGDFLVSHGQLAHIAARFALSQRADKLAVRFLGISGQHLHWQLEAKDRSEKNLALEQLLKDCRSLRIETVWERGTLDLRQHCDQAPHQRPFRYSVDLKTNSSETARGLAN
jgi:hypothetical protein